jgi:hypothetical protein
MRFTRRNLKTKQRKTYRKKGGSLCLIGRTRLRIRGASREREPFFEPQEKWDDGGYKLFCGKHAFNNLVGRPLMTMGHVYTILGIDDPEEQAEFEGNFTNEELQMLINTLEPRSYSAFMDLEFMTRPGGVNANNNRGVDEIVHDRAFHTKAGKQRVMSDEIKGYISTLYSVLLTVPSRAPDLTGFILQVSYGEDGHYIALKRLADGSLMPIDSMKELDTYDPIPFFSNYVEDYRHNCARLIAKIFELAGITKYDMKKIGPGGKLAQLIVVKPYEPANNYGGCRRR